MSEPDTPKPEKELEPKQEAELEQEAEHDEQTEAEEISPPEPSAVTGQATSGKGDEEEDQSSATEKEMPTTDQESSDLNSNGEQESMSEEKSDADRREFLEKVGAGVAGGFAGLTVLGSGFYFFLDPLRRTSDDVGFTKVATLDSVPDDGIPRQFPVLADRTDAWNRFPNEPVGAVFLQRLPGETEVRALNAICPHVGCFVDFKIYKEDKQAEMGDKGKFKCPCHDSSFQPDGTRINPESCPSPRGLDTLRVDEEKLKQGEVWVEFKNFRAGKSEKIEDA